MKNPFLMDVSPKFSSKFVLTFWQYGSLDYSSAISSTFKLCSGRGNDENTVDKYNISIYV